MKNGIKDHSKQSDRTTVRLPQMIFKIVIVHENLAAALRAKELADRLAAAFSFEVATEIDYWKFDWLAWSPFREQAADATTRADLVIFSAVNNDMPPLAMQTWIESWLPQKRSQWSAVTALIGGGRSIPAGARRLSRYLHDLATKAKIDFFSNVADEPTPAGRRALESVRWPTLDGQHLRRERVNPASIVARSHSLYCH
jgi:hypothetical protein